MEQKSTAIANYVPRVGAPVNFVVRIPPLNSMLNYRRVRKQRWPGTRGQVRGTAL